MIRGGSTLGRIDCNSNQIILILLTCFIAIVFENLDSSCFLDEKVPVQCTNIPYHLEQMRDILRHEEDDQSGGTTVHSCV